MHEIKLFNHFIIFLEIPGIPSSVRIKNITNNSAIVSWAHSPQNDVNPGTYTILCKQCPSGVFPRSTMADSIKLDGLGAFATYQIQISYANNISEIIGENSTTECYDLKTKPGGTVQSLNINLLSAKCVIFYHKNTSVHVLTSASKWKVIRAKPEGKARAGKKSLSLWTKISIKKSTFGI